MSTVVRNGALMRKTFELFQKLCAGVVGVLFGSVLTQNFTTKKKLFYFKDNTLFTKCIL